MIRRISVDWIRRSGFSGNNFERELSLAFHMMAGRQFGSTQKLPGAFYTAVFPRGMHITSSPPKVQELIHILQSVSDQLYNSSKSKQIFEYLKNSTVHGGDALVVLRLSNDYKAGRMRQVLEVTVWDNGPGIKDPATALAQSFTSKPDHPTGEAGAGKGIDLIIRWEDTERKIPSYAADELLIESGYQKAERKHNTDAYRLMPSGIKVPGTRITAKFWL